MTKIAKAKKNVKTKDDEINVKKIRKKLGLSQQKLADILGLHLKTIQNYEKGTAIPKSKQPVFLNLQESINSDSAIIGNNNKNVLQNVKNSKVHIDDRKYYSDSPDVLRVQIEEKEERIKEKDAQIKEKDAQIKEKDAQIKQLLEILAKK